MNVLIACEESQTVCKAFRTKGHNAFSCDIQEPSGGHPEWHIHGDVLPLLNGMCSFKTMDGKEHTVDGRWDLIIAHPPCTYISCAGACRMYPKAGKIDEDRYKKALQAKEFFLKFLRADCEKICVENPKPLSCVGLPPHSIIIQPWEFGDPYTKKTMLWIKGLPPLMPIFSEGFHKPYLPSGTSRAKGTNKNEGAANGSRRRSKTFPGIAEAMAEQWGG
jgi:hypothetical protein